MQYPDGELIYKEPILKEKQKDGYIEMNKEVPELILSQKKEQLPPDPIQQKKDFQEKKLNGDLRKKRRIMTLKPSLRDQIYHPEVYHPKSAPGSFIGEADFEKQTKENQSYETKKRENLKKASVAQNTIARTNVETDKKIARISRSDNETMKLILEKLNTAAAEKQKYLLSMNRDPSQSEYIRLCVELDKLMKLDNACRETIKDPASQKKVLADIGELINRTTKKLQAETTKHVVKKETPKRETPKKETPKKETPKKETPKQKQTSSEIRKKQTNTTSSGSKQIRKNNPPIVAPVEPNLQDGKLISYKNPINDKQYYFVKEEPKSLREALNLRSQITKNFDVENSGCPEELQELYDYYQGFVEQFEQTEEIQYPPEYLQKVDVSGYTLEVVASLRNRLTAGGLLYRDLKGQAKEAYDYYDRAVKQLRRTDGTMKETVDQHAARKTANEEVQLQTNLGGEYEKQESGSNDCWSCAGSAIINHFLRKEPNYQKVTQADFRSFKPQLKSQEEMGVDEETYTVQKAEIDAFTVRNRRTNRLGSPMGNPYMVADFYLRKLAQAGKRDTAVRKMVFQAGLASRQVKGLSDTNGKFLGKDINALHNLREKFKETVLTALKGDSALTLLSGLHYYTIVGIKGEELIVHNSSSNTPGVTERLKISSILRDAQNQKGVELVWLQKMKDPAEVTSQFKNLSYNQQTKEFHERVRNYSENIGQKDGVGAWKTMDEKDPDVSDLIMEGIYLPKHFG